MKFFNKQRRESLSFKKIRKYLAYAVGEVILVVIGILIAVAINNRNEQSKLDKEIHKIAAQVYQKIDVDLNNIIGLREALETEKEKYDLYLGRKPLKKGDQGYLKSQVPNLVTRSAKILPYEPLNTNALEKAISRNDSLANVLSDIQFIYTNLNSTLKLSEEIIFSEMKDNLNYIKDNFSWYEKLYTGQDLTTEEYNYFDSQDYHNRVVHMDFLCNDMYDFQLENFQEALIENKIRLEKYIH